MPLVQPEKKGGEGLNMDVRMVSGSEIQAEGLLSDPWSDSGRKENQSVLQKNYLHSPVFGVVLNLSISEYSLKEEFLVDVKNNKQPTQPPPPQKKKS